MPGPGPGRSSADLGRGPGSDALEDMARPSRSRVGWATAEAAARPRPRLEALAAFMGTGYRTRDLSQQAAPPAVPQPGRQATALS